MQVARLNRLKDHLTAVRAIGLLARDCPNVRLILVGDGEERPAIESLVEQLGLQQQVRLLGTRHDVDRLLQAADIFLLTSISEGIPLTLIEAMASEVPCVATDVGGNSEVIVPSETGLLAEPKNPLSVASAIRPLLDDAALRQRMGKAGCVRVREMFGEREMHSRYDAIYREMTGAGCPGSNNHDIETSNACCSHG